MLQVACPNTCDVSSIDRCDLPSHLMVCPLAIVACPNAFEGIPCDFNGIRPLLAAHAVCCLFRVVECDGGCGAVMCARDLSSAHNCEGYLRVEVRRLRVECNNLKAENLTLRGAKGEGVPFNGIQTDPVFSEAGHLKVYYF